MQQELLSDAPSLKAVRMKKRQRPESAQLTLEHRLSMVSGGLAARFLGRIALAQVRADLDEQLPYRLACTKVSAEPSARACAMCTFS